MDILTCSIILQTCCFLIIWFCIFCCTLQCKFELIGPRFTPCASRLQRSMMWWKEAVACFLKKRCMLPRIKWSSTSAIMHVWTGSCVRKLKSQIHFFNNSEERAWRLEAAACSMHLCLSSTFHNGFTITQSNSEVCITTTTMSAVY